MMGPYLPFRWMVDTPNRGGDPDIFPLLPGQLFVTGKSPGWSTTVKRSRSGREFRIQEWSAPEWRFRVSYEFIREKPPTQRELSQLFGFFNARAGRAGTFFYWDPSDHAVTEQQIGVGDGTTTQFQLTRTMGDFIENVLAVYGVPVIKIGGVETTAYSLLDFGRIVFDAPVPLDQPVHWSGEMMFWCNFDQDEMTAQQMYERIWSVDGLTFKSLKR